MPWISAIRPSPLSSQPRATVSNPMSAATVKDVGDLGPQRGTEGLWNVDCINRLLDSLTVIKDFVLEITHIGMLECAF